MMSDQPETRIREAMAAVHDCRTEAQRAAGEGRQLGLTPTTFAMLDAERERDVVFWQCFRCGAHGSVEVGAWRPID